MNNFNFDITVNYMNEEFTINLTSGLSTNDEILEELKSLKLQRFEEQSGEDAETSPDDLPDGYEIISDEVPGFLKNKDGSLNLEELTEFFDDAPDMDIEIIEAALKCDIQWSDIEEAYNGEYSSNEDFAREMAEQLGAIDKNAQWPQNCIDWEYAAKELMYDYSEHNGHYFRML